MRILKNGHTIINKLHLPATITTKSTQIYILTELLTPPIQIDILLIRE